MMHLVLLVPSTARVGAVHDGEETQVPTADLNTGKLVEKFGDLALLLGITAGTLTAVAIVLIFFVYKACLHRQQGTLPAASSVAPPQGDLATETLPTTSSMVPTQGFGSTMIENFPLHSFPCEGGATFGDTCGICIEDFADGETMRSFPNCGHLYHSKCLESWLNADGGKWCPYCKCDLAV